MRVIAEVTRNEVTAQIGRSTRGHRYAARLFSKTIFCSELAVINDSGHETLCSVPSLDFSTPKRAADSLPRVSFLTPDAKCALADVEQIATAKRALWIEYMRIRKSERGVTAENAWRWAKGNLEQDVIRLRFGLDWIGDQMAWTDRRFSYVATMHHDAGRDCRDYLGTFTEQPQTAESFKVNGAPHGQPFFTLGQGTLADERAAWHKSGMAKHDADCRARSMANAEALRVLRFDAGAWHFIGVEVKVFARGVLLGQASLWGIENDSGERYLIDTALELVNEAKNEARETLRQLSADVDAERTDQNGLDA